MLSDIDWNTLSRYVAGEVPTAERAALERWIHEDPEREHAVAELHRILENRGKRIDADAAWLRLEARMQAARARAAQTVAAPRTIRRQRRSAWTSPWLKAAVLAAVVAGGALVGRALLLRPASERGDAQLVMREVAATERGEIQRLRLSDSTEVVLGPASRLLVSSDYGDDARAVQLDGDGFFDVAHDSERPFIVRTATATAQALGTEFGVLARDSSLTRVVVSGGRVLVKPAAAEARSEAVVNAGELAQVTPARDAVDVEATDPERLLAWRDGRLVFQNQPLAEVLDQLGYWFAVEFAVEDSVLARRPLSGSFHRPTLRQVLESITLTANATYRVDGRRVTVVPKE